MNTPENENVVCEYCNEHGFDHRRPNSKPMSVWVASERDRDGQPTHLIVAYAAGEHVSEVEAEYVRRLLRDAVPGVAERLPCVVCKQPADRGDFCARCYDERTDWETTLGDATYGPSSGVNL